MSNAPYRRPQADTDEIIKAARRRARAASSRRRALVGDAGRAPIVDGALAVQPAAPVEAPVAPDERPTEVIPERKPRQAGRRAPKPVPEPVEVPRPAFIGGVVALVVAGIVGLLLLNTVINEDAYHLQELRGESAELAETEQRLADELTRLNSPNNLEAEAVRLGLVEPDEVTYLFLPEGETMEVPLGGDGE